MKSGRLSPAERAEIEQLADRGLRAGQIAIRMDRHSNTIGFLMSVTGLRICSDRTFAYQRRGRPVRSFSPDEDALIEALRCQAYTYQQIASVCGARFGHARTAATIGIRLKMLAARREAAA